jgi:hypothetical protein
MVKQVIYFNCPGYLVFYMHLVSNKHLIKGVGSGRKPKEAYGEESRGRIDQNVSYLVSSRRYSLRGKGGVTYGFQIIYRSLQKENQVMMEK